jgi:holo-[acyl-carrier protein] synthase
MILGIGNDLIDITRIENTIARYGDRFIQRIFTPTEQAKAKERSNPIPTYAKRFAAKEACSKALGTGFRNGVFFRDMGVINMSSGKPTLELTGGALKRLQSMTPPGMIAHIHLTITDEHPMAEATVIIEAVSLHLVSNNPVT